MKKLLLTLILFLPVASHADTIKGLITEALIKGQSKGVVTDGVADIFKFALKTKNPVPLTITKIYSFPSGCGRLHMVFTIIDGIDANDRPIPPQDFWIDGNLCANGQGPAVQEFKEWQEFEKKKDLSKSDKKV